MSIVDLTHPEYDALKDSWKKWRATYKAGDEYIEDYLVKFSARESDDDFRDRKAMTYVPAFAKAAVDDVKNAIFQRTADITREDGPESYKKAVLGLNRGVDRRGSTMNSYIGRICLPELLSMAKIGIYVDRSPITEGTKAEKIDAPYLYMYQTEDILSWTYRDSENPWEFESVLLRDNAYAVDDDYGLPEGDLIEKYRLLAMTEDEKVSVRFFDENGKEETENKVILEINRIPFVVVELSHSLLNDVANHQIALLNASSSDVAFLLKGNFPFYVEQYDERASSSHLKKQTDADVTGANDKEVVVGSTHGRRYAKGMDRPDFIAPPTDPIIASMQKQEEIKAEIRQLVNLSLSSVKPKFSSAESKSMDERGLEAGLSYIGMELEHAERQIAALWATYEGTDEQPTVHYPERYTLKSDADILAEAKELEERMAAIPSVEYKRDIAKRIVLLMIGSRVSLNRLETIYKEIDKTDILTTVPDVVFEAVNNAILDNKGAAIALGFPPNRVEQAIKDHADRASRIAEAQAKASMAARGVDDLDADVESGKKEKEAAGETALDDDAKDKTRGEGK